MTKEEYKVYLKSLVRALEDEKYADSEMGRLQLHFEAVRELYRLDHGNNVGKVADSDLELMPAT